MNVEIFYTELDDEIGIDYLSISSKNSSMYFGVSSDAESIDVGDVSLLNAELKRMGNDYYKKKKIRLDCNKFGIQEADFNEFNSPTSYLILNENDELVFRIDLGVDVLIVHGIDFHF